MCSAPEMTRRIAYGSRPKSFSPKVQGAAPLENPHSSSRGARVLACDPAEARPSTYAGGRRGKERVASLRAEQRLAAGGCKLPRPGHVTETNAEVRPCG